MMSLRKRFFREIGRLDLPLASRPRPIVTDADLVPLPAPVQRFLRYAGVVGRPRDWSFRLSFAGRFKTSEAAPWRACEVWQYNTAPTVTRTFLMCIRFGGLPVIGRDTYRDGRGHMIGKVMDLVPVIDGSGPEFDVGELVTYLNDIVLIAPSMLLMTSVSFEEVDGRSFDVSLADHGRTVKARVFVDEEGAPVDFETTDRFLADFRDPKRLTRTRWSTPMEGFQLVEGRRLPRKGLAVWKRPEGDFPYADFTLVPESVAFNVRPGE